MAKVIRRRWHANFGAGITRRDRGPCEYEAYVPDALVGRRIVLDGEVAADVADAEAAIAALNQVSSIFVDAEALARLLLRAESVASSRIEGLEVGARRLLRAEFAQATGEPSRDVTAREVLGNIDAMTSAIDAVGTTGAIALDDLLTAHAHLLEGTRIAEYGGTLRREQNWIGGSSYNPCSAAFVPPPPELVPELLEDLIAFSNQDV
jgi:Fic family protein